MKPTRDPARIDAILKALRGYWTANPDLRLGQIVMNATVGGLSDTFYAEDESILKWLKERTP